MVGKDNYAETKMHYKYPHMNKILQMFLINPLAIVPILGEHDTPFAYKNECKFPKPA